MNAKIIFPSFVSVGPLWSLSSILLRSKGAWKRLIQLLQIRAICDALQIAQAAINLENAGRPNSRFVGAKTMLASILHQMDQKEEALNEANDLISQLYALAEKVLSTECDIMYGQAGALHAIKFLRKELEYASLGNDVVVHLARHNPLCTAQRCSSRVYSVV
jgi:hypothetical protein